MISLKNQVPLPFDQENNITQYYQSAIKNLNSWKEKFGPIIIENIIHKALNSKRIIPSYFYTDEQLSNLNDEIKKELEKLIHQYKEFKQFLIFTGLLKTFSDIELQQIKDYINEISPEIINRIPIFIIWFIEEMRREIIDSCELLNMLNESNEKIF